MNQNHSNKVWILSIHDSTPQGYLAFDVSDIIKCIYDIVINCHWIIFDLDCTGEPMEEGIHINTHDLMLRSRNLVQTIEGKFLAYSDFCPDVSEIRRDYSYFPESQAKLAIVAVDSSFFEVYCKDLEVVQHLKERFKNVAEEDACKYFLSDESHGIP